MIKKDIVKNISKRLGIDEDDIRYIVDAFCHEVNEGISRGENVSIRNFGSFIIEEKKSVKRFDINKGKVVDLPSMKTITFKEGKIIKNYLKDLK